MRRLLILCSFAGAAMLTACGPTHKSTSILLAGSPVLSPWGDTIRVYLSDSISDSTAVRKGNEILGFETSASQKGKQNTALADLREAIDAEAETFVRMAGKEPITAKRSDQGLVLSIDRFTCLTIREETQQLVITQSESDLPGKDGRSVGFSKACRLHLSQRKDGALVSSRAFQWSSRGDLVENRGDPTSGDQGLTSALAEFTGLSTKE